MFARDWVCLVRGFNDRIRVEYCGSGRRETTCLMEEECVESTPRTLEAEPACQGVRANNSSDLENQSHARCEVPVIN